MSCEYIEHGKLEVSFWGTERGGLVIDKVRGEFFDASGALRGTCDFVLDSEKNWKGIFDAGLSFRDCFSGRLKLTATDSKGEEHVIFENTDSRSVIRISDISAYMKVLSELEDVSILVAAKGNASKGLSQKVRDSFGLVGLDLDLPGNGQVSLCAVKGNGFRDVKTGEGLMILNGNLGKADYEIASSDSVASVVIGKKEYSQDSAGFNIVVFDERSGKVVDSAAFDLSPDAGSRELNGDTVATGIRYDSEKKTIDLWITPVTPDVLAGRQLNVYMFTWDKENPKKIARVMLSKGRYMTYRDGSNVPYYFVKDFDVSGYDPASFGMLFYFTDDMEGKAVWRTKTVTNLTQKEYKDPQIPSSITFKEE